MNLARLLPLACCAAALVIACNTVQSTGSGSGDLVPGDDDSALPSDSPTPTPACDPLEDLDGDEWCIPEDCDDFNFNVNPGAPEICDSGRDDDCDGDTDCADADCGSDPICGGPGVEICSNGLDDDGDGAVDCDDADCAGDPACNGGGSETSCTNNLDDDGDGLTDCNDPDCFSDPSCAGGPTGENCTNGMDDDGDGWADCDDSDCDSHPNCQSQGCGGAQYILNGGFESGDDGSWGWFTQTGQLIIRSDLPAYAGSWIGLVGYDNNEIGVLAQDIVLPTGCSTLSLSFRHLVDSAEGGGIWDVGGIYVLDPADNSLIATIAAIDNSMVTGGWVPMSFDLTPYAGRTVRLQWEMITDGSLPTSLVVDEVSVIAN